MQESHTPFRAGQHVLVRDEAWTIVKSEGFGEIHVVHLRGAGATNHGRLQSFITPFDRLETVAPSTHMRAVSRRRALTTAALAIADAHRWDHCWTAAMAHIELRAWQLQPALAAVRGATRILLADRVGLGKTIQAALIISELLVRGLAERVLVLTPASLRQQWAGELRDRFHLAPAVFDRTSLLAAIASLPVGMNPWQTSPLIVSSVDLVKRPEVRTALDEIAFDVLVVDEAHHLAPGTDRAAVVAELAARTPWVVLVTATPHCGDDAAFQFLRRIGAAIGSDLLTFRRSIAHPAGLQRRSRLFAVSATAAERLLLEETLRYARAVARAHASGAGARLVATVIARRAASSAQALCRTLARRIALLARDVIADEQPCLPWEEDEANDSDTPDALLSTPGLADVEHELAWLRRLLLLAENAAAHPSKISAIRRLLRRTSEPVIVFSEYRDVVTDVGAALEDLSTVALLHGGLSSKERHDVVSAFNDGLVRTLVATDAAGEGLNLHHRCRLVVNIELPWMPRRLEQRIGRVDRFGQTRRVHALQLVHRDSFEATVIARLERRRALADEHSRLGSALDQDTPATGERRLRRALRDQANTMPRSVLYATRCSSSSRATPIVLLYGAVLLSGTGRLVQQLSVPIVVTTSNGPLQRRLTRRVLRRLTNDRDIRNTLEAALALHCAESAAAIRQTATAIARRLDACLDAVQRKAARQSAWQGSLFDRSADAIGERQQAAFAGIRDHLVRRRVDARELSVLSASDPRLIVAWRSN
jgi:superfamily II DNA or RNA helicase